MTEQTKVLKNPPELDRLYALRAKLYGTDRDDHLAELDMWEKKIKKALIFLNLKEHEGIPDLIAKANEEIHAINIKLLTETASEDTYNPEALIHRSLERQRLLDLRSMWTWFKSLFEEAKTELSEAEAFLVIQEDDGSEKDDYQGQE